MCTVWLALLPKCSSGPASLSLAEAVTSMIFVATEFLSRQKCVCRDKTRLLSRRKYDHQSSKENFVATSILFVTLCLSRHIFVATNTCSSRQ